jgi:hypothetical protein
MAMVLQPSRIRLTQAIYFGKPAGFGVTSITDGNGTLATPNPIITVGSIALGTLTADHDFGNFRIDAQNTTREFNVIAYGADPTGGNIAATTAAIAAAYAACVAAGGGTVLLPHGTYGVNSQILIGALGTATRGIIIKGEAGPYASPGVWKGTSLVWSGPINTAMFRFVNVAQCRFDGICLDGGDVAGSTAMLWDNDGTAGAPSIANTVTNAHIRRFHDGICVGTLTAAAGTPNTNTIDSLTVQKVSFYESITGSEGTAIFLNCPNFTAGHFSDVNVFQWRKGVWVNGSAGVSGGNLSISDSTFGANGGINMDAFYIDQNHGLINISDCEAENFGAGGHYLYVPPTAPSVLTSPISIRNSNTNTILIQAANTLITQGCAHAGVITLNTAASHWTSIADSFNGGAPVLANGSLFTKQNATELGVRLIADTTGAVLELGSGSAAGVLFTGNQVLTGSGNLEFANVAGFGMQTASAYYGFNNATNTDRYMTLAPGPFTGLGVTVPTRTLDVAGTQRWRGIAAPAVSEANSATMYFDSGTNTLKASLNGGAYVNVLGSGGVTGSGTANRVAYWTSATDLTTSTDVIFGGGYPVEINGSFNLSNAGDTYDINGLKMIQVDQFQGRLAVGNGAGVAGLGFGSMAVGYAAGNTATGLGCTLIGTQAAQVSTGDKLTAVGDVSLLLNSTGQENVAVGFASGGTNTTGSSNVFIGSGADASAGNLSHAIAIGANVVVGASNSMILGDGSNKVGIRTTTPAAPLDVNGAVATRHKDIALVNGLNSDIALTDASFIRLTGPTAVFSIGGFTNGVDGRILRVVNTEAFAMTIVNLDAGSAATNQITTLTGADVTLRAGTSAATFIYDDASDTWILMSTN